ANAGGVTVSYFEWLKNLSHVSFGRLDRRYAENTNKNILNTIESATGLSLSAQQREIIAKGASELELVNSGLEDTMVYSYHEIKEKMMSNNKISDLRTAAFALALDKIATSYLNMGIWP